MQRCKLFWLTGSICLFLLNGISTQHAFAFQTAYWVSPGGSDTADGSLATPFQTINHAFSVISATDTVLLMPGTYQENVVVSSLGDFVLKSASAVDTAHIEAPLSGPVVLVNGSGVTTSRNTIIENILISHMTGISGPGLQLSMASATVRNNRIFNNQNTSGAAVSINSDGTHQPLLEKNIFESNSAVSGGALTVSQAPIILRRNIFRNNTASQRGGAVYFVNCFATSTSANMFYGNQADSGAAIFIDSESASLTTINRFQNNILYNNISALHGGGLFYQGNAVVWSFTANTFAENYAQGSGGAGFFNASSSVIIQQNIVVQNRADNDGGAFVFANMGSASVNLWSNNITGNVAGNNGGGIYVSNASQITIGGANNLSNNLFHNRDNSKLNNITSSGTISNLNLSQNFWGGSDSSSVLQQLSIPNLDQNATWDNFSAVPVNITMKLLQPRNTLWFDDGRISVNNGFINPVGDSTLVIRTNPDTTFVVNQNSSMLHKIYSFDWRNITLSAGSARLTFFLDETELNDLGNPFYQNLRVLQFDNPDWTATSTDADVSGLTISTTINDLAVSDFTIGLDINASDTVLIVDPRPNKADVNKNEPIRVQFQKAMEIGSLTKQNIQIHASASGNRDFDINFDPLNNRLYLVLNDALRAGERVSVVLSDSLKTQSGESFNGYSWQYITSALRGNAVFRPLNNQQTALGTNHYLFNDFNNDLIPELIELSGSSLSVYTINNDGSLNGQTQNLPNNFSLMRLADLDNDFLNDIILFNDSEVLAYSYNPSEGFGSIFNQTFPVGDILNDVLVFDFNNDVIPDIAFLKDVSDFRQVECYYGTYNGTFRLGSPTSVLLNGPASRMHLQDWNADGLFDLVVSNGSSTSNLALITNRKTAFSSTINPLPEIFAQTGLLTASIWEDLQFQNQSEIIVSGQTEGGEFVKLFNVDEDGGLVQTHSHKMPSSVTNMAYGDLNSDGFNDLALAYNNGIKILFSNPSGTLQDTMDIATVMSVTDMKIIDFDADGDLDLFVYQRQDGQTTWQIYQNETRAPRSWWVNASVKGGDGSPGKPFTKIVDAVAKTFEDDSVFVFPGSYAENLTIKHSLFVSSADSLPFLLLPATDNFFQSATIQATDVARLQLANFHMDQSQVVPNSLALSLSAIDSVSLQGMHIERYQTAVQITDSKGEFSKIRTENNITAVEFRNSSFSIVNSAFEQNSANGIIADNSILGISESSIRENGTQNNAVNAGLSMVNGSEVTLSNTESSRNGNVNIHLDNATLTTRFVYIGQARSNGASSAGNGIFARNNSAINIFNTVLDNNFKTGIVLDNSDAVIQNSVMVNNDSLRNQAGGALFVRANSIVDLRNTIFVGNNTALSANASTVVADYNNFFGNASEPQGALLGTGNINANPLLVFMYNPLDTAAVYDGFVNAKLAPGSPLIDRGDPAITNGAGASRSDIGLFGNVGLPQMFESIPEVTTQVGDSSVTVSWSEPPAAENDLWVATAIFRNPVQGYHPDTTDLIAVLPAGTTSFTDTELVFGEPYYYRAAYVDSNGGANAYSVEAVGRIDFSDFRLQNNTLNVQLGQGDTLQSAITVINSGTLPVTVEAAATTPSWLSIIPAQRVIEHGQSANFLLIFNASGLQRDSLYSTLVNFFSPQNPALSVALSVRMLVSYRDFRAPQVSFIIEYPDTVRQAGLSFVYTASDSINSTIGTPTDLLMYVYRFATLVDGQPVLIASDTTRDTRIDFYPLDNGRYLFELAAIDTAGNGGMGINSETLIFVLKIDDLNIAPRLWQMVTIPRNVLDSGVAVNRQSIESLRHWNGTEYEHVTVDSVLPGKGYWVITKDRKKIDLTRFPMVSASQEFAVSVDRGWNMIGSPWSWDISLDSLYFIDQNGAAFILDEAVKRGYINGAFYLWRTMRDTQEYKEPLFSRLRNNTGYWMFAEQAGRLGFNPKPFVTTASLQPRPVLPKGMISDDAVVRLKVRQGTRQDNTNYFGVCRDKSIYPFSYRDALEAPAFNDNIRMYYHKEGRQFASNLVTGSAFDSVQVWDLYVEGNDGENDITITWDYPARQDFLHFFLYNLESGKWIKLQEQNAFVISSKKTTIPLKLYAAAYEDFKPEILPTKFSVSQNYPNPFNPSTSIKINIPYYADDIEATVDIFDVLGRKVKNILNRRVKSGEIEISWQGTNTSGDKVASGVYFYRLQAGEFVSSRKMILIR